MAYDQDKATQLAAQKNRQIIRGNALNAAAAAIAAAFVSADDLAASVLLLADSFEGYLLELSGSDAIHQVQVATPTPTPTPTPDPVPAVVSGPPQGVKGIAAELKAELAAVPVEEIRYCPDCGAKMWDNQEKKASGQFSAKSPDYSCKDKCGGPDSATWLDRVKKVYPKRASAPSPTTAAVAAQVGSSSQGSMAEVEGV